MSGGTNTNLRDELASLQHAIQNEISERSQLEKELQKLEEENKLLRTRLESSFKDRRQQAQALHAFDSNRDSDEDNQTPANTRGTGTPSSSSQNSFSSTLPSTAPSKSLTFLAATTFLSAANSVLRSNLLGVLAEQRKTLLDISDLNKQQRMEIEWILTSSFENLYRINMTKNPFFALTSNPNATHSTITSTPATTTGGNSNSSANSGGQLNLSSLSTDFKNAFSSYNAAANAVEDVHDALNSNRTLYAECEAKYKYEAADDEVADAMENFGFSTHQPSAAHPSLSFLSPTSNTNSNNSSAASSVYEFDEEDSPTNIVMENDPSGRSIKCATLNKLIERVTHEKYVDLNTRYVFLLTFHSFTTPKELLHKLGQRWDVPIPPNLTTEEIILFKTAKLDRIQIRVCSVLKNWIDEHYTDFIEETKGGAELKLQLNKLIEYMLATSVSVLSTQLAKSLQNLIKKREKLGNRRMILPDESNFPQPLIDAKISAIAELNLEVLNEMEIARQLSLLDFEKFKKIMPRECLNQNWSKKNKYTLAPNIMSMIDQFNMVSHWVQWIILSGGGERKEVMQIIQNAGPPNSTPNTPQSQANVPGSATPPPSSSSPAPTTGSGAASAGGSSPLNNPQTPSNNSSNTPSPAEQKERDDDFNLQRRVVFYRKCIAIAEQCRLLNNFNSCFAIYCGLTANAIHRLRKTKELIGSKYEKKFEELKELFKGDKNSLNFRRTLQTTLTPCIPHLGIFLKDLTFIEDGHPDELQGMINFQKRCKLAERIRWIKQYQQEGYQLRTVPVIQQYFQQNLKEIDGDTLWKISREVEPQ